MAGGPVNACATQTCTSIAPFPDPPSMQLTVTGASGTVNWAGETWNLPADSGVTKCACPTTYLQQRGTGTTGGGTPDVDAVHRWQAGAGTSLLKLERGYNVISFGGLWYRANFGDGFHRNVNYLRVSYDTDDQRFYNNASGQATRPPVPATYTNTTANDINKVLTVPYASYSDYQLPAQYFGTHTIGSITYTWSKGINWP